MEEYGIINTLDGGRREDVGLQRACVQHRRRRTGCRHDAGRNNMFLSVLVVAGIIALDQLVKYWSFAVVRAAGEISLIDGVFYFVYTENRGAAFSILQGQRWFFLVATVLAVAFMIWMLRKGYVRNLWGRLAVLFIIGGALGNFVDRLRLGYVIDMFDFRLINFAVFNVADSFIVVGGIMYVIYFLFMDSRLQKALKHEPDNG